MYISRGFKRIILVRWKKMKIFRDVKVEYMSDYFDLLYIDDYSCEEVESSGDEDVTGN